MKNWEYILTGVVIGFLSFALIVRITLLYGLAPDGTVLYQTLYKNHIQYSDKSYKIWKVQHEADLKIQKIRKDNK